MRCAPSPGRCSVGAPIESRLGLDRTSLPELEFGQALDHAGAELLGAAAFRYQPTTLGDMISGASGSGPTVGWIDPASGPIVSRFGMRSDPFTGQPRMHNGIDIDAPMGAPILATEAGTVTFAGERGGFGQLVIVDHGNGVETYYAHQSRIDVAVGDPVLAGQQLGAIGSTGRSTGPHLHFEVRIDGTPVDPEAFGHADHEGHDH